MIVNSPEEEMTWDPDKTKFDSSWESSANAKDGHVFCLSARGPVGEYLRADSCGEGLFIRIKMTREEHAQMLYAMQIHGPAQDCPRCGNNTYRLVPEKRGPHFGTVECARCGRFVRWASRREALKAAGAPQPDAKGPREAASEYFREQAEADAKGRDA